MQPPFSKTALKTQLIGVLEADLALRERAYRAARDAATHDDAKPENDKDTRSLELTYLARGEALRVEDLRAAIADVRAMAINDARDEGPVRLGSVVMTDEDGAEAIFWLAPHGGGARLVGCVQVVTPGSPLGQALLGKYAGDECEALLAGRRRDLTVVSVA